MARISEIANLDEKKIQGLAASYDKPPEAFLKVHPRILKEAWKRSGGNWHKCTVTDEDGFTSIVVHNTVMW